MPLEKAAEPLAYKTKADPAATPSFTAEGALVSPRGNARAVLLLRSGEVVGRRSANRPNLHAIRIV